MVAAAEGRKKTLLALTPLIIGGINSADELIMANGSQTDVMKKYSF